MFAPFGLPKPSHRTLSSAGIAVVVTAALLLATPATRAAATRDEVRALWVTRASLTSPRSVHTVVQMARASGFNTLLVQVRGRGDAYFESALEPRADLLTGQPASFDPLATLITQAQGEGLRVHAWVNVNLISSAADLPASRDHLIYRHPEWLMLPRQLAYSLSRTDVWSPEYLGRLARWTRAADDV